MRNSFEDYNDSYAEAENHQMLLNLARLADHDPSYFFQFGDINALYEFTGTLSANGGQSDKSMVVLPGTPGKSGVATKATAVPLINWIFGGASGSGTTSSKPQFQYVPLNGGNFAAHLIAPLPSPMFHSLFREGFPVDTLMRAMVQQVSMSDGTNEVILFNIPTRENETNYESFLRLCGILRDLQLHGYLMERLEETANTNSGSELSVEPTPKDMADAMEKGMNWKSQNGKWHLEKETAATNSLFFELTPGSDARNYLESYKQRAPYNNSEREGSKMIDRLELVLDRSRSSGVKLHSEIQFRSFLFVLAGLAGEDEAFRVLEKDAAFCNRFIPESELRPVLRLDWSHETAPLCSPLAKLTYRGRDYAITDVKYPDGTSSTVNRDAFSLANILITQISIDPTQLNYSPQLLQVR